MRHLPVVFLVVATALAVAPNEAAAGPRVEQEEATTEDCRTSGGKDHIVGALLDVGGGPGSAGVRYLHSHRAGSGCGGLGAFGWVGYGADVRVGFDPAAVGYGVVRAGGLGDAGGGGFELGLGVGSDFNTTRPVGIAGLFYSLYYVELGGSYQFPVGYRRPDWLGSLQFALRIYVPVHSYDEHDERLPPPEPNDDGVSADG